MRSSPMFRMFPASQPFFFVEEGGGGGGAGGTGSGGTGTGTGEGGTGTGAGTGTPVVPTFTQEDLNRIAAREKNEGRRSILADLGFEDPEALKTFIEAKRQDDKDKMTEADRKTAEAVEATARSNAATASANALALTTKVERALEKAGVPLENSSDVRKMVDVKEDATPEELTATVEDLKKRIPSLFGPAGTGTTLPNGDPGSGGQGGGGTGVQSSTEAATALLHKRHPEIKARQEAARAQ